MPRTADEERTYRLTLSTEFDKLRRDAFARVRDLLRATPEQRAVAGWGGKSDAEIALAFFQRTQAKIDKRLEEFDRS